MGRNKKKKNIHDAFVRRFFRDKRFAIDIFLKALSPAQFALFAWESLKPEETSYFDHEGNEKKADLVFSVKLKKNRKPANLVILIEHKSYQDSRMMQQILEYLTVLSAKYKRPVIPIVLPPRPQNIEKKPAVPGLPQGHDPHHPETLRGHPPRLHLPSC